MAHEINISAEDVRKYIAPQATHAELWTFLGICRTLNLSPLKNEIFFVKYDKDSAGTSIVSYSVYLARAESSGKLDGWHVDVGTDENGQEYAEITIYRKDFSQPFVWRVLRKEFDTGRSSWKRMPNFMIRKVAIGQGFRLAFPVESAGLPYILEEVQSFSPDAVVYSSTPGEGGGQAPGATDYAALRKHYYDLAKGKFETDKERHDFTESIVGKRSISQLTESEYQKLFDALDRMGASEPEEPEPSESESDPIDGDIEFPSQEELANGASKGETAEPEQEEKPKGSKK